MRAHRFFVENRLEEGMIFSPSKELHHQLFFVLRLRKNDIVILFNGSGYDFPARISDISAKHCVFAVGQGTIVNRDPKRKLVLFQSLIKKDKFEWVLEKGVEVGISEFVPVLVSRSIKKSFDDKRAFRIIKEAAEQSGRAAIPKIRPLMMFEEAIRYAAARNLQVFFASPTAAPHEQIVSYPSRHNVGLFIGPEGGWTQEEIECARKAGHLIISLGKLILKSETASIVGAYHLLH